MKDFLKKVFNLHNLEKAVLMQVEFIDPELIRYVNSKESIKGDIKNAA